MSSVMYRQCRLEQQDQSGRVVTTTWLPEVHKGIRVEPGVQVKLKDHVSGEKDPDFWTVAFVSQHAQTAERAHHMAHAWSKYMDTVDA